MRADADSAGPAAGEARPRCLVVPGGRRIAVLLALATILMALTAASPALAFEEGFEGKTNGGPGVEVWICEGIPPNCPRPANSLLRTITNAEGAYGLPIEHGEYYVYFFAPYSYNLLPSYYKNLAGEPAKVVVSHKAVTPGVNGVLAEGGQITGSVINAFTKELIPELANPQVTVFDSTGNKVYGFQHVESNGKYKVNDLPTGEYLLRFWAESGPFLYNYYPSLVKVAQGSVTENINEAMWPEAFIEGGVYSAATHQPIHVASVKVYGVKTGQLAGVTTPATNGIYEVGVPAGEEYRVEFIAAGYTTQFYKGKATLACGDAISLVKTLDVKNISVELGTSAAGLGTCSAGSGGGETPKGGGGQGPGPTSPTGGLSSHVGSSGGSTVGVSGGSATVVIQCVGEAPCTVEVVMTSSPSGKAASAAKLKRLTLGRAKRTIPAGKTERIAIKLTPAALKLLRTHHGRIHARLTITGKGGSAPINLSKVVVLAKRK